MSFCTAIFLVFLPAVFALHWAGRGRGWQNGVLLVASYAFYGWWDWRFCGLMLGSSVLDYAVARRVHAETRENARKRWVLAAVGVHLVVLGYFKYFGFFADSFVVLLSALGLDLPTTAVVVILPLGISFYTFQSMAYVIDVHRRKVAPSTNLAEYLVFVAFFPQLVAGPIERAGDLLPQFRAARRFSREAAIDGLRLMLWGFTKKMLVADNLAGVVNPIFERAATASAWELWLGAAGFGFQIYGDFSGYSDIAAGLGALFGIRLSRNFRLPYFAGSLTEFWRRWHVTLSEWMRDYVYVPLGGSRGSTRRGVAALTATFLLSGFWHGADWRFLWWGAFHGVGVSLVHAFRRRRTDGGNGARPARRAGFGGIAATFAFVTVGWVFFRAPSAGVAWDILGRMLLPGWGTWAWSGAGSWLVSHGAIVLAVAAMVGTEWLGRDHWNPWRWERLPRVTRWLGYTVVLWMILLWGTRRSVEFVYFQF